MIIIKKYPPNNHDTIAKWLSYLKHFTVNNTDINLNNINVVAKSMKITKPAPFVFIVAGTNGKGTTCKALETILIASGYRVGTFNSPHIMSYKERIRIQGMEIPDKYHINAFHKIQTFSENIQLTFFEYSTLSAIKMFIDFKLDVVILEVGIGGRLDATNIVNADIAIITAVSLDHTETLGNSIEQIAKEKAGIFRKDQIAVINNDIIPNSLFNTAKQKGTHLIRKHYEWDFQKMQTHWSLFYKNETIKNIPLIHIPTENIAAAIVALKSTSLNINNNTIVKNVNKINLAGRFQIIDKNPYVILDVAHNPDGSLWLSKKILNIKNKGKVYLIIGMLKDKDIYRTVNNLSNVSDYIYCTPTKEKYRGMNEETLFSIVKRDYCYNSASNAYKHIKKIAKKDDIILICGSFYTVKQILKLYLKK